VRIVFQITPETEAPAEMNFFFPDHRWLCMAENCSHNMHNLIPIRGAQARDSLVWSKYIGEAIELFGDDTEIMFASHHWPRWGNDDVRGFLTRSATCTAGCTTRRCGGQPRRDATEIAEQLALPARVPPRGEPHHRLLRHLATT
jgi:alkyl sulfatase BDS1-like metallo-beta-lactamase superfamily hydrolase